MKYIFYIFLLLPLLTSCNGIDLGVYDNDKPTQQDNPVIETDTTPDEDGTEKEVVVSGEIYIDASSWTDWYYVDLHDIHRQIVETGRFSNTFPAYPIPLTATEDWDGKSGVFFHWYDVWGEGLSINRKSDETFYDMYGVSDIHTSKQPEPQEWDFAIHRDNVRTNGGAAYETSSQSMASIPSRDLFESLPFTEDSWNETDVWTIQDYSLTGNVGDQAISINTVLSTWLSFYLPPIPPAFTYNGNVFILRMKDGRYAALRLKDYVNRDTGVKCCMTIEFKYPLL